MLRQYFIGRFLSDFVRFLKSKMDYDVKELFNDM